MKTSRTRKFYLCLLLLSSMLKGAETEHLVWSELQGAKEAQLKLRYNNPYFPKALRNVTQDDIIEAAKVDGQNYQKVYGKLLLIYNNIKSYEDSIPNEGINELREELEDLQFEALGYGGQLNSTN